MFRQFTCALLAAAALLAGCKPTNPVQEKLTAAPADPLWSQLISAHSTGAISRHSPLRVAFTNEVIPGEKVGSDASAYFSINPTLKARITFTSTREIVATPESGELAPGATYKVTVNGKGLEGINANLNPFEFLVETLAPNFGVTTQGLAIDPSDDERMVLRGTLSTADTEDGAKVEKVLMADLAGAQLPITWQHHPEFHGHEFMVSAIVRSDKPRNITLAWDGAPLGVKATDKQVIEVPARGVFAVSSAQAYD